MKTFQTAILLSIFLVSTVDWRRKHAPKKSLAPESRIGVDNNKRVMLTMREAVTLALENNRDIAVERENIKLGEWDLKATKGVYDPNIAASLNYQRVNAPVTSLFGAGNTSGLVGSAAYAQKLQNKYGSSFQATFDNTSCHHRQPIQ